MICLPRIFCPPLARRCSLMRSPELNPKTEPLTQRAAHGFRQDLCAKLFAGSG